MGVNVGAATTSTAPATAATTGVLAASAAGTGATRADSAAARVALVEAALARYGALAAQPLPAPSAEQLAAIAAGETLSLRQYIDVPGADNNAQQRILVAGYQFVPRPRLLVWLATLEVNAAHSRALTEHLLQVDGMGGATWYQHLNLPWPLRNRHWMIRSRKDLSVAAGSDGQIWEHRWQLVADGRARAAELLAAAAVEGLSARDGQRAIYLTLNRGAWTMIDLGDDTTLVITHALAAMGGWIPDEWVAGFVARQLREVLQNLRARADLIHAHYGAEPPVYDGDGRPIDRALALQAWRDYSTGHVDDAHSAPRRDTATESHSHDAH